MRVAFYAPMKSPGDPVPSGDRTMARLLVAALRQAGYPVELAATFRSFDPEGDAARQRRLAGTGAQLADRLLRRWRRRAAHEQPQLWFTYHLYHKAPDHLGPRVCDQLGLPYVVAEASSAGKRATGAWASGWAAAKAAIRRADLILALNPADEAGLRPLLADAGRLKPLPPFIDTGAFDAAAERRDQHRRALCEHFALDPGEPLLLAVAMLRPGDRLASFRLLARAMAMLADRPWRLLIAGDGPARDAVEAALAPLGQRCVHLGLLDEQALPPLYAACDLFVWPAIGEAWGMALLEAQAAGLPVIAGRSGGVASVVADGKSGVLVTPGDATAFAAAVGSLLSDLASRERLRQAARTNIARRHNLPIAARALDEMLRPLPDHAQKRRRFA